MRLRGIFAIVISRLTRATQTLASGRLMLRRVTIFLAYFSSRGIYMVTDRTTIDDMIFCAQREWYAWYFSLYRLIVIEFVLPKA